MIKCDRLVKYGIKSLSLKDEYSYKPLLVVKYLTNDEEEYRIGSIGEVDIILTDILYRKTINERLNKINKIKEKLWKQVNYQKTNC